MGLRTVGQAVAMFAVTNIDDIVILALFFGQAAGHRVGVVRIVLGQYLGFAAILVGSVLGALGAGLRPSSPTSVSCPCFSASGPPGVSGVSGESVTTRGPTLTTAP